MAEQNITTKFRADVSDFKKGITEINKRTKLIRNEFKAVSAGMDNWKKSETGLLAKKKELSSLLTEQTKKMANYKAQLKQQEEVYNENKKRADALKKELDALGKAGKSDTDEFKNLQKAIQSIEKEMSSEKVEAEKLSTTILGQQGTINRTERDIKKYDKALKQVREETKQNESALGQLISKIEKQENELSKLKNEYKSVSLEQGESSTEAKKLANNIDKLSTDLKENKNRLNGVSSATDKLDKSLDDVDTGSLSDGFTVLKGVMANFVTDGLRRAGEALKDFVKGSIEAGSNFSSAMSQVEAVSGAKGSQLDNLTAKAKEMGASTKFTATQVADGFNYMAMAGWKTEDMLNGISGVLDLAAASNSDLATTSDIVTDALTAMGYTAKDSSRLADVMASASSNANTNVELMGGTFQYVAPVVGALKYSMEDTALSIGLLANAGIKGQKAGTNLRAIFSRLSAPTKEVKSAMDELGISVVNSDGSMKPLRETMGDLRQAFSKLGEAEQAEKAKNIAGQQAMSGLLAIVNASESDYKKLALAIDNSDGSAQEMAKTMQDNLQGSVTATGSKLEGFQIKLFKYVEPAIRLVVDAFGEFIDWLSKAIEKFPALVPILISTATGFTALAVAMGIQALIKSVTASFDALNISMNLNPAMLIATGIISLATAFVLFKSKNDDATTSVKDQSKAIDESIAKQKELEQAKKEAIQNATAEHDYNASLKSELEGIVNKNGEVKKGYEDRAEFITNKLNEAYGTEMNYSKGIVQGYQSQIDKIDELIEKKRAEAIVEAHKEEYVNAIKSQEDAYQKLGAMQEDYNSIIAKIDKNADIYVKKGMDRAKAEELVTTNMLSGKEKAILENYEKTEQLASKHTNTILTYEDMQVAIEKGNYKEINQIRQGFYANNAKDDLTNAKSQLDTAQAKYNSLIEELKKYNGRHLTEEEKRKKKSLESQANEAKKELNAKQKQYDNAKKQANKAGQEEAKAHNKGVKSQAPNAKKAGENISNNAKSGMASKKNFINKTGKDTGSAYTSGINKNKKSSKEAGGKLVKETEKGIKSGEKGANKASDTIRKSVLSAYSKNSKKFKTAGKQSAQGIASGLLGQNKYLSNVMSDISKGMINKFKKDFKIKSPSRIMAYLSKFIPLGIAKGVKSATGKAVESIKNLSKQMLNSALKANGNYESITEKVTSTISNSFSNYIKKAEKKVKAANTSYYKKIQKDLDAQEKKLQKKIDATKDKARKKALQKELKALKKKNKQIEKAYGKAGNSIANAYNKALEKAMTKVQTKLNNKLEKLGEIMQNKYDDIISKRDSMESKLSDVTLFTQLNSGRLQLTDLNKEIDNINAYEKNMQSLKKKISSELMDEIAEMSIDDAMKFTNALLNMSEEELKAYDKLFLEKESRSTAVAKNFYKDEFKVIKAEYDKQVKQLFKDAQKEFKAIGKQTMQGLIDGIKTKKKDLNKLLKGLGDDMIKQLKKMLGIKSTSKKITKLNMFSAEEYSIDFTNAIKSLKRRIENIFDDDFLMDIKSKSIDVNGMGYARQGDVIFNQNNYSPKALSRVEIYRQSKNAVRELKKCIN